MKIAYVIVGVPVFLGMLVGLVVSPFIIGFLVAYEFLADRVAKAQRAAEVKTEELRARRLPGERE